LRRAEEPQARSPPLPRHAGHEPAHLPPRYYEDLERDYGANTPMARRFLKGQWIEFATEKPFKSTDIQTYGHENEPELPEGLIVEGAVDPAISEKDTAATSAIVIAGQARRGLHRGRIFESSTRKVIEGHLVLVAGGIASLFTYSARLPHAGPVRLPGSAPANGGGRLLQHLVAVVLEPIGRDDLLGFLQRQ
jgi:hypothetical protein